MEHEFQNDLVDNRPTVFATVFGIGSFAASYWVAVQVTMFVGLVLLEVLGVLQFSETSVRPALILFLEVLNGSMALWMSAAATRRLFSSANHKMVVNVTASVVITLLFLNVLLGIEALRPHNGIYGVLAITFGILIATQIVRT